MARTKQVARTSTGGYAARKSFALVEQQPSMPSTPEPPSKRRRSTRTAAKTAAAKTAAKTAAKATAKVTAKATAGPPRLTIKVPPPKNSPPPHDLYCCICSEGGNLYLCNDCPRVACDQCVEFTPQALALLEQPDVTFVCPQSHLDRGKKNAERRQNDPKSTKKSVSTPYTGLLLRGAPCPVDQCGFAKIRASAVRGHFPRMDSTSLAVVNIRLKIINPVGDPAVLVHRYLEPYFQQVPGSLFYHLQELDVEPEVSESLACYKARLDKAVEAMAGVGRVLVFLQTHSVPDNGDLHTKDGAAVSAHHFLNQLFGNALPILSARIPSMLVVLSCGGLFQNPDSFNAVARLMKKKIFQDIVGFGAKKLVPHAATCLLEKLVCKRFIEDYSVGRILPNLLREEEGLGPHTSVYHMADGATTEYIWHHKDLKPFGDTLPPQCTACGHLFTLSVKHVQNTAQVSCKQCGVLVKIFICEEDVFKTIKPTSASGWCTKSWR